VHKFVPNILLDFAEIKEKKIALLVAWLSNTYIDIG
jgi:hypothetical protein